MARRGMGHRGPGMGHGGHGMPGEKAKDFKGTMRKLMTYLGMYKIPLVFVVLFAVGSTVFNILGPKILGNTTGLTVSTIRALGAAPIKGPKKGITFVTPTITLISME